MFRTSSLVYGTPSLHFPIARSDFVNDIYQMVAIKVVYQLVKFRAQRRIFRNSAVANSCLIAHLNGYPLLNRVSAYGSIDRVRLRLLDLRVSKETIEVKLSSRN